MVRADRNYPDVYFGRPGAFVKLPYPRADMDKTYDKSVFDFETGAGMHQVSSLVTGSRQRSINWAILHVDNYAKIEQFWTGHAGRGPWVFIDPSDRNLLSPNQSSATSVFYDARDFNTATGTPDMGQLQSNGAGGITQHNPLAARSLRWYFPVTVNAFPVLFFGTQYRNWPGIPVVPGMSYAASAWARPDGVVDSAITLALKLQWLLADGSTITEISGGDMPMTGWTRPSVVGVAPPTAVYARLLFVAIGSTVTVGGSIYLDELMFEQDTVVNDWAPGTGLRPVEMLSLTDGVPFNARFRKSPTLTLRELAP